MLGWLSLWAFDARARRHDRRHSWFQWTVTASLFIAVIGLAIGFEHPRADWMKFYPFRLADVLLPVSVSLLIARRFGSASEPAAGQVAANWRHPANWRPLSMWLATVASVLFGLSLLNPLGEDPTRTRTPPKLWIDVIGKWFWPPEDEDDRSKLSPELWDDWIAMCDWVRANTPADTVVLTPRYSWAFKWYAERAEYVSLKDCPQDPRGIVEWHRRVMYWVKWKEAHFENGDDGYTEAELRSLARETGIHYVIAHRSLPISAPAVHTTRKFAVYKVSE
jgi:hypothetical protein